jgi:C-3',4' desaturase CrtD
MTDRIHDILVIGAGIGGLTAAAMCADAGLDVLVLEGHTRPGGCAGDFTRRGILFPAGATVVMGFEEGGLHRQVYEQLGLPISARLLDLAMTVHLPDRTVHITTDRADWPTELRRAFPDLGRGGDRFWSQVRRLADTAHGLAAARPLLPLQSFQDVIGAVRLARPQLLAAAPALFRSVADMLRAVKISDNVPHRSFVENQLLISMQCLAEEAVAMNGAFALDVYRRGTFHLVGGTATIAHDLVSALQWRGGAIRYHSWVRQVGRSGELWHVTTADGERFTGRAVVSNLPTANLRSLLDGPPGTRLERASHQYVQPWGAVVLYAALDAAGLAGPLPQYHQLVERYDATLEDGGSCFLSVFGPEGNRHPNTARLTVSTHTRVDRWWHLPNRLAYQEAKAVIGERLLNAVERVLPDVRRRIRFAEVSTPRSYWRWTGRHEGRVGGVPQALRYANLRAQSHRTGLDGLYQCGDSIFPGQGTIGVTLSGLNAAYDAVRAVKQHRRRYPLPVAGGSDRPASPATRPGGRP